MNIWIVLWVLLAGSLLFFFAWTFLILVRQKAAWKVYAEKRKFRYNPASLMGTPEVSGTIGDHSVTIFSSEHLAPDARATRKLTAIEVSLNSIMPIVGGVASGGMISVLSVLNLKQEFSPKHQDWNKSYMAGASNRYVLEAYLNDARLKALCDLMTVKNAWVIFVFKDDAMLLRVDTPDPLDNPARLDKLIKQMVEAAKVLELEPGESKRLKSEDVKSAAKNVSLEVDEDAIDTAGLALEDDASGEAAQDQDQDSDSENEKP